MPDEKSPPTVFGLFADREAAERGITRLAEAGFGPEEIGYLTASDATEPNYARNTAAGIGGGAALGGATGVVLGAAAVGAIPGIGPVLVAGALVPILMLGVTGASAGATMGGLFAAAASQDQAMYFMQEVQSGRVLVTVTTPRTTEAVAALHEAGALEATEVGAGQTAEKATDEDQTSE
jgi:hypothetical protein